MLAVSVVVTVRAFGDELAAKISFDRRVRVSRYPGDQLDPGREHVVGRSAADAAAEEDVDALPREEARERAAAGSAGADHLALYDLAVFDLIDLHGLRVSEMLENSSVVIGCCDFHSLSFLFYDFVFWGEGRRRFPGTVLRKTVLC